MGRRNNNGYIGLTAGDDISGMIDREKSYQIRYTSQDEQYFSETSLISAPPLPDFSLNTPITASSGQGSGSAATSSLVSGSVSGLIVYRGGTGWTTTNATMSFSGGGGTGARGYVTAVAAGAISTVEPLFSIQSTYIANGGGPYSSTPTASFSAPITANGIAGVTATASVTLTNGVVTAVTVTNTGSNYRGFGNFPTITMLGGGLAATGVSASVVPVIQNGRNYTSAPTITLTGVGSGAVISSSIVASLS